MKNRSSSTCVRHSSGTKFNLLGILVSVLTGLMLIAGSANVADCRPNQGVREVGSLYHLWDYASAMKVRNDTAFVVVNQHELSLVDVNDPTQPHEISYMRLPRYEEGYIRSMAVSGSCVYIGGDYDGLIVIDFSDPFSMREIGYCDSVGEIVNMEIRENLIYAVSWPSADTTNTIGRGLHVIDISDPSQPRLISSFGTEPDFWFSGLSLEGDHAFILDMGESSFLRVIDISDPTHLTERGSLLIDNWCDEVEIAGDFAIISALWECLVTVDISDPNNPVLVSHEAWGGDAKQLIYFGNYIYAINDVGLWILDLSEPAHLRVVSSYRDASPVSIDIDSDQLYMVSYEQGMQIFDLDDPGQPSCISTFNSMVNLYTVAMMGHYAVVGGYRAGLRIVDVSNPTEPTETGYYHSDWANLKKIVGNHAYLVVPPLGISIVDMENPANPVEVGNWEFPGNIYGFEIQNNLAYAICKKPHEFQVPDIQELKILDVTDQTEITESGSFSLSNDLARKICTVQDFAYINYVDPWPQTGGGIRIFDLSDPLYPIELASYHLSNNPYGMASSGTTLFLLEADFGLEIIDFNNPEAPRKLGQFALDHSYTGIRVYGNHVFLSARESGVRILDVTNLSNPYEVGYFDSPYHVGGLAFSDNFAYMADGPSFRVFDCSEALSAPNDGNVSHPMSFALSNYPNPFNSYTTVNYSLPVPSDVRLMLFNPIGQEVNKIASGMQPAGNYSVTLNGEGLATGTYLLKMEAGEQSTTRKVVMVK